MAELLTSAQMRAIEGAAIASGAVTGLELMERAGQGVVDAVFAEWPDLAPDGWPGTSADANVACGGQGGGAAPAPPEYLDQDEGGRRAVVLCGPGNNGGDGFVVARLLAGLGWAVDVFLYGDPEKLPPDARVNYERWCEIGGVEALAATALAAGAPADLYVDALFGTGLTRPLEGAAAEAASFLRRLPRGDGDRVVSVDAPSGLCLDSGAPIHRSETEVDWVAADLTVTFHVAKLGHVLRMGPAFCGRLAIADIGLNRQTQGRALAALYGETPSGTDPRPRQVVLSVSVPTGALTKRPHSGAQKYTHGHALVLSGGPGRGGAARLAARAALRVGAGLVTLGCPHEAHAENAAQLTAVMLSEVDDGATLARLLADKRLNALVLGPGLGLERARDLVPVALEAGRATVLDADALTAFAHDPAHLFAMLHEACVLTPHGGEFARLFPDIAATLAEPATRGPAYSKVDATRAAAQRAGCTVLFKGPDTVIAAPDGRASVNAAAYDRAAPWLATAGSGDVLAGMIAGLLARCFAPMEAAETAAWLHVEAARSFGPGLIAEDLPEELPKVFRALGL
ncbi:MAG: NAD(P)H-hydrate dehydratase [Maritimibacter sp.]|nr:NAD(P)H-hydrate dehydratase [Maritimibacter sp.]